MKFLFFFYKNEKSKTSCPINNSWLKYWWLNKNVIKQIWVVIILVIMDNQIRDEWLRWTIIWDSSDISWFSSLQLQYFEKY